MKTILSLIQHFLILFAAVSTASVKYDIINKEESSKPQDYDEIEFVNQQQTELDCACMNGGTCALDNDFCVCPPEFTGRHCELKNDNVNRFGCGLLLNEEEEYLECAKCKCSRNILTCTALSTPVCNIKLVEQNGKKENNDNSKASKNENSLFDMKGTNLLLLLNLINSIENYAYQFYINDYKQRYSYDVVYRNIEAIEDKPERELYGKSSQAKGNNEMIVYRTNDRIIGLYFNNYYALKGEASSGYGSNFKISASFIYYYCCMVAFLVVKYF